MPHGAALGQQKPSSLSTLDLRPKLDSTEATQMDIQKSTSIAFQPSARFFLLPLQFLTMTHIILLGDSIFNNAPDVECH
jgi:hypothetical protein